MTRASAPLEPLVRQDSLDRLLARRRRERAQDHDGDPDQYQAGGDDDQENAAHSPGRSPLRLGGVLAPASGGVLPSGDMTRNTALKEAVPLPDALAGRSIVLVGLMGAGKTSIGRRLAARLGMPFRDADAEIELAAGCTIS